MPIPLPDVVLPPELTEEGPADDSEILLSGLVNIGPAPYRMFALRIDPSSLEVDYRDDVDEEAYEDYDLDDMLEDLTARDDLDASVLVPMNGASYVVWMMPYLDADEG
jgi:hypothetical protein